MLQMISLETYLAGWSTVSAERQAIATTVLAISEAARGIADLLSAGSLAGRLGAAVGPENAGDQQKQLDVLANDLIVAALKRAPVALIASEELDEPLVCNSGALLAVAIDPLDGSSNIDTNAPVGTIFSIVPANLGSDSAEDRCRTFLRPGSEQKAAGYIIYGPQCALVLTVGKGTHVFTLDRASGSFKMTGGALRIPEAAREYAINASNQRHWSPEIKQYVADLTAGREGPRGEDYNMRWLAALVGECHRILTRGGVYLYPGDCRRGYAEGRLRLIYEANPIAMLTEQAGGKATDGTRRILNLTPTAVHQRVPLVFGSAGEVECVAEYAGRAPPHAGVPRMSGDPLFRERGLYQAS